MRVEDIYVNLFGWGSTNTYYSWKKEEKRLIIKLLEKYFSKEDLKEFIETGKISKIEKSNQIYDRLLFDTVKKYFNAFSSLDFESRHEPFIDFYIFFLHMLTKNEPMSLTDHIYFCISRYTLELQKQFQIEKNHSIEIEVKKLAKETKKLNLTHEEIKKELNEMYDTVAEAMGDLDQVRKNLYIFDGWDSNMIYFLSDMVTERLIPLYHLAKNDAQKKEAISHIAEYNSYLAFLDKITLSKKERRNYSVALKKAISERPHEMNLIIDSFRTK